MWTMYSSVCFHIFIHSLASERAKMMLRMLLAPSRVRFVSNEGCVIMGRLFTPQVKTATSKPVVIAEWRQSARMMGAWRRFHSMPSGKCAGVFEDVLDLGQRLDYDGESCLRVRRDGRSASTKTDPEIPEALKTACFC